MSLISGAYFRGDPKIKPEAWGPVENVQASILSNSDRIGINPTKLKIFDPFWMYGARNYIENKTGIIYYNTGSGYKSNYKKNYLELPTSPSNVQNNYYENVIKTTDTDADLSLFAIFRARSLPAEYTAKYACIRAGYSLFGIAGSSTTLYCTFKSATGFFYQANIPGFPSDDWFVCTVRAKRSASTTFNVYLKNLRTNEYKKYTATNGNSSISGSTAYTSYGVGGNINYTRYYDTDSDISLMLVTESYLSESTCYSLLDNPYCLLQPISRRSYFFPFGDITIKTISDSGFCSDTISGLSNQISVIDIGSGIDGFYGMSANLSISDSGSGAESIKPAVAVSVTDISSAIDVISQILNVCSVVDSCSSADRIANTLASIAVTDVGSGFDIINVLKELLKTVTDSCSCVDNVSQIAVSSFIPDSASGIDIISQIIADISVTDNGSGADFLSLIRDILKTISETATGADNVSIPNVSLSIYDAGLALDIIGKIAVAASIVDSSTAADVISTIKTKLVLVTDSGAGSDVSTVSVSLTVQDMATAIDTLSQIVNALSVSDSVSGLDSITKTDFDLLPSGRVKITITVRTPGINITLK